MVAMTDESPIYVRTGREFAGHTTVIHSCEKIKRDLKVDAELEEEINQVRLLLK